MGVQLGDCNLRGANFDGALLFKGHVRDVDMTEALNVRFTTDFESMKPPRDWD